MYHVMSRRRSLQATGWRLTTHIVTFRRQKDRRPSKFIVMADSMREAIEMAWESGGADFQGRFDRVTGQAEEMKKGALRVL